MTPERIKEATAKYSTILIQHGATPHRQEGILNSHNHLLWMCNQLDKIVDSGRMEKAMRWLGFIQGAFWSRGILTIEDMKHDNMSKDAEFSAERV